VRISSSPAAAIHFDRERWPEEATALESLSVPDLLCVGLDLAQPARGLGEIVNARRRGTLVAALIVHRDPLEILLLQILGLVRATADPDTRALQLAALRDRRLNLQGKSPEEMASPAIELVNAAKFALRLADFVLVATPADRFRLERLTGTTLRRWTLLPDAEPLAQPTRDRDVTVYAPSVKRAELAGVEMALELRGVGAQLITAENARDAIRGATVVLPELWRGRRACALAAAGYRVAVPEECGAELLYHGIATYNIRDPHTIGDALDILAAMSSPAPKLRVEPAHVASIALAERPPALDGPLLSLVIRTADRPEFLRRALASVAQQGYRNIEIVLVNNGSQEVLELAQAAGGGFPIAYVRPPAPVKLAAALNLGMQAATGTYIGYLDDDDIFYPDHCARSVALLEQTGADLSYSKCVGEYSRVDENGVKHVLGMQVYTDWPYRLDDLYSSNLTTIHSVVHRRELFDRFGFTDESLAVTEDWELWLRMASGGARFVHLDRPTCEYSWRDDKRNPNTSTERRAEFALAYETILERYHSHVANRTGTILPRQQGNLAHIRSHAQAVAADPAAGLRLNMQDVMMHAAPVEGLVE